MTKKNANKRAARALQQAHGGKYLRHLRSVGGGGGNGGSGDGGGSDGPGFFETIAATIRDAFPALSLTIDLPNHRIFVRVGGVELVVCTPTNVVPEWPVSVLPPDGTRYYWDCDDIDDLLTVLRWPNAQPSRPRASADEIRDDLENDSKHVWEAGPNTHPMAPLTGTVQCRNCGARLHVHFGETVQQVARMGFDNWRRMQSRRLGGVSTLSRSMEVAPIPPRCPGLAASTPPERGGRPDANDAQANHGLDAKAEAAAEAETERRKFVETVEAIKAPIKQMTALRDAIRSPVEKITRVTDALRNPLADAVRGIEPLVSPFRDLRTSLGEETMGLMGYKGSLGEAVRPIGRLGEPIGDLGKPVGHLAGLVSNTSLGKAAMIAERLEQVGRPLGAISAFDKSALAAERLEQVGKPLLAATALERAMTTLMPTDPFKPFEKIGKIEKMAALLEAVATEPTFPEPRVVPPMRVPRREPPPPEKLDVEITPRCDTCGNVLRGELAIEQKPWAGPGKVKGDLRVSTCEDCIRKAGGDPTKLPKRGPKRPAD